MKRLSFSIILILLIIAASNAPQAKVTGMCSDCHTMHYSQHGGTLSEWGSGGPYEALTVDTCVGCHSGDTVNGTGTPVVLTTTGPPDNILAGGNFYYVTVADANGHNVAGIADIDPDEIPPGHGGGKVDPDEITPGSSGWADQQVTCAGEYGCHGRHNVGYDNMAGMKGAHHGDSDCGEPTGYRDGTTLSKSYRFLNGIMGVEDSDWEYSTGNTDHNWYQGATNFTTNSSISYLCAECHADYHDSGMEGEASHWKRHPGDGVLLSENQGFSSYNPTGIYDNNAPVAYTDPTSPSNATAVVMCLSCHRAHASPYGSNVPMFRGSNALVVCNKCHNQ